MNKIIVGERNIGKTTFLLSELEKAKQKGKSIYVMDSATEHTEKSLIRKVEKLYSSVVTINDMDEKKIVLNRIGISEFLRYYDNFFPFAHIIDNKGNILCFDLSYFLEKGHSEYDKTHDINIYNYYRRLYNELAEQIALSLILCDKYGIIKNSYVVTDEIEFPISENGIEEYQEGIEFLSAVHEENAFGTFYKSFESQNIKKYTI